MYCLNLSFKDTKPSLPKSCLPPMVPHFTGRQRECEEITGHMTSGSNRIVSIWGSPGFGKTSVAIAVGHNLDSKGLPVYFLSLRGVQSKADLTSKLLSIFRRPATNDQQQQQRLSLDDELFQLFDEISDSFVLILDNTDDLLESGISEVKEDSTHFLEEILRRTAKVTFLITTRASLEFMNVQFQGHRAARICPLDEYSSQTLVLELLPSPTAFDCTRIPKICCHVPLAMKLLCSSISEDDVDDPSQALDDFTRGLESSDIVKMLDNSDYPSHLRLKLLFDSSFRRLSAQEKEALVSLSDLPDSFDLKIAGTVLGMSHFVAAKNILQTLRRRSFLDSGSKSGLFAMHTLLQSFAKQRGEHEMKGTILDAKSRLRAFYVSRFEELNEQFLKGNSMSAFVEFYEHEQGFLTSLTVGCYDSKTCDKVFRALVKGELFLDSLFWCEGEKIDKIYHSAIEAARKHGKNVYYRQLLVSLAFTEVTWGSQGRTMHLLSKGKYEPSCSSVPVDDRGKHLCYSGIYQLVNAKTEHGVQLLEEALSFMDGTHEQKILRIIIFQILAIYYRSINNPSKMSLFYSKALQECRVVGDKKLLIIPAMKKRENENKEEEMIQRNPEEFLSTPLTLEVLCLVSEAIKHLHDPDTKQFISSVVLKIAKEFKNPVLQNSLGLFNFQRNVNTVLENVSSKRQDAAKLSAERILYHERAIEQCKSRTENSLFQEFNYPSTLALHQEALAKIYADHGVTQHEQGDFPSALQSKQRSLDIRLKLFGEEHSSTADSYQSLGITQHERGDFPSALQSKRNALDIRLELVGEEHSSTADSYHSLGYTQRKLGDFSSALQSAQRALDIRRKLFGEEHSSIADSYHSLGVTQLKLGDFPSALQSAQRALDISLELFGEEHPTTADSYHSLGNTQHKLGDFSSALQSKLRTLDIRRKLFGEEHSGTADSYHSLGTTQQKLGDPFSALQSRQRALDIRRKLFGEGHPSVADSYHLIGITQHEIGEFSSALQSAQRALDIRCKMFGEEHPSTANSCHLLESSQHQLGDFSSALQSKQRTLDIRRKLFGEEHPSVADSYHSLGVTQHELGDFQSALQSAGRALDINRKLFGEEHSSTADSYQLLDSAQHELGDFSSALQSARRCLDIRHKLFGEEHPCVADSYHSLGVTQHELGDFSYAFQFAQHALDIRRKLFGEEHSSTADSYHSLVTIQHQQGDFPSALQSAQRALDIRLKLFGEEHPSVADSYHSLGVTQHKLGDFPLALQSVQHALHINRKLFGVEHSSTADSYHLLESTQHELGNFFAALQSAQRALDIRRKLFGEEHPSVADSYHSLGVTQHELGDFSSALQSAQRALGIRRKLFGEEHSSTADSYYSLGTTQYQQGDFFSALQSAQRALDIRLKLFGEEHPSVADSYHLRGVTHHELGDFSFALQSKQRALDIRRKLFGEEHSSTADSYHSLVTTQHQQGDFTSAL